MDDVLRSWWATLLDDTVVRVQVGWFPATPAVSSWRGDAAPTGRVVVGIGSHGVPGF